MRQSGLNKYGPVPVTSALSLTASALEVDQLDHQPLLPSLSAVEGIGMVSAHTNEMTQRPVVPVDQHLSVPALQQKRQMEQRVNMLSIPASAKDQDVPAKAPIERPPIKSIVANIVSTLFLRIASRISFVVLGFYLGEHFASAMMVAMILEAFYVSELVLAPMIGTLSDRFGRKPFLLLAPLLGAVAAICLLAAARLYPRPDGANIDLRLLGLLALVLLGRLLEGATTAFNAPASLGYITDVTIGSDRLRMQVMTMFEVATVGGLALATPLGGTVSALLGTWGFLVVVGLHIVNVLVILFFVVESQVRVERAKSAKLPGSLWESLLLLRDKHIFMFLPAWLAINTLVGAWITLIVIMLTYPKGGASIRHPGQLFYGGFSKEFATLLLGGFGLLFLLGMGLWLLLISRLRRTTVMLIGLGGLTLCISSLSIMNRLAPGVSNLSSADQTIVVLLLPILVVGILLLSGFTPASLIQMSVLAEMQAGKRGAVMGLYSVILGVGQLLGATVGGFSVDRGGFSGLMVFSVILGLLSLGSVVYMRIHKHDLIKVATSKVARG